MTAFAAIALIGFGSPARAQETTPGTTGTATVAQTTTPSGDPLAAGTHSVLRRQSEVIDLLLDDYLFWRLRRVGEGLATTTGEGIVRGMSAGAPNWAVLSPATLCPAATSIRLGLRARQ